LRENARRPALDRYFTGIEARVIDKPVTFNGALARRPLRPAL